MFYTQAFRATLLIAASALLGGCTVSQWQAEFVPSADTPPAAVTPSNTPSPVTIREVEWSRVQAVIAELRTEAAASDVHPSEWPPEKKDAQKAVLLRGLQVSEPPESVRILGRSEFRTTSRLRPTDPDLQRFARSIGATMVVISTQRLGTADTIVNTPVTEYRTGWWWESRSHDGRRHSEPFSSTSTTYIPVRIQTDEYGYIAFFLDAAAAGGL